MLFLLKIEYLLLKNIQAAAWKRSDFIQAIGKLNNQFVLILDLEKIVATIQKETAE